ncbi:MAG: diaminopimelate epimerase [Oligoflexia bacterium]|nr:diaminopimelate epimerase [Oligoflexia bacterium]
MSASFPFTKLEGIGNDFVLIDDFFLKPRVPGVTPELARRMLDRRFGVGGDQLLWLKPPLDPRNDARMEILNPDGSVAEMCGNGIRAFALYFHRRSPAPKTRYQFETLAGTKVIEMIDDGRSIRVDMGPPWLGAGLYTGGEEIALLGARARFFEVNMGNPHAVFFSDDLETPLSELPGLGAEAVGPVVERHPRFPERTNVEFVQVLPNRTLKVRVWERGTGLTLACGSGACASAVAALATGRVAPGDAPVRVVLPGGELQIIWSPKAGEPASVFMEGPAREVFSGEMTRVSTKRYGLPF